MRVPNSVKPPRPWQAFARGAIVSNNAKLVHKRKGARRRSKVKLLLRLALSLIFLATAALLSAGIVRVVERPEADDDHHARAGVVTRQERDQAGTVLSRQDVNLATVYGEIHILKHGDATKPFGDAGQTNERLLPGHQVRFVHGVGISRR